MLVELQSDGEECEGAAEVNLLANDLACHWSLDEANDSPPPLLELYMLDEGSEDVPSDLACRRCGSPGAGHLMVLCDGCQEGEHTFCMKPPLHQVPRGPYFCSQCMATRLKKATLPAKRKAEGKAVGSPLPPRRLQANGLCQHYLPP